MNYALSMRHAVACEVVSLLMETKSPFAVDQCPEFAGFTRVTVDQKRGTVLDTALQIGNRRVARGGAQS